MTKEKEIIIDGKKFTTSNKPNPDKVIRKGTFKFYRDGIRWGIAGGLGMAAFLVLGQLMVPEGSIALKFFKYISLGAVLIFGLSMQRSYMQDDYKFRDGMLLGAFTTLVSAITLIICNIVLFATTDSFAFDKFSKTADSFGNVMLLNGVIFFEVLVFGMIITFICLQSLKPKRPSTERA